ncbi:protein-L-isoaspartate(D-aspartate) O-methyltransferase [Haloferacaceae archaeon DSL9]
MTFETLRDRMVDRLVSDGTISDGPVAAALRAVPRHEFVPERVEYAAYRDEPLPIGGGQTISAPHIVGVMLELLAVGAGDRVLEIGTGCGYHAAVTAELVGADNVYSVEYDPTLAERARERFDALGYEIYVRVGDGREGWSEHAPYDGVYLTCAPATLPDPLLDQIRPDGALVAPVGRFRQRLIRYRPRADGSVDEDDFGGVRFVSMRG